jgi:hypothetical protein
MIISIPISYAPILTSWWNLDLFFCFAAYPDSKLVRGRGKMGYTPTPQPIGKLQGN